MVGGLKVLVAVLGDVGNVGAVIGMALFLELVSEIVFRRWLAETCLLGLSYREIIIVLLVLLPIIVPIVLRIGINVPFG